MHSMVMPMHRERISVQWYLDIRVRETPMGDNMQLTENESIHIWQRAGCIIYDMELTCLKQGIPNPSTRAKSSLNTSTEQYQSNSV
jgi:hypothetical protein